jgi:hypothetical protein
MSTAKHATDYYDRVSTPSTSKEQGNVDASREQKRTTKASRTKTTTKPSRQEDKTPEMGELPGELSLDLVLTKGLANALRASGAKGLPPNSMLTDGDGEKELNWCFRAADHIGEASQVSLQFAAPMFLGFGRDDSPRLGP